MYTEKNIKLSYPKKLLKIEQNISNLKKKINSLGLSDAYMHQ